MCIRDRLWGSNVPSQLDTFLANAITDADGLFTLQASDLSWTYYHIYLAPQDPNQVQFNTAPVSYTHLRAHETVLDLVCRLLLEKKKKHNKILNCTLKLLTTLSYSNLTCRTHSHEHITYVHTLTE